MEIKKWLELFFSKQKHQMPNELAHIFLQLILPSDQPAPVELNEEFLYQLVYKRASLMFSHITWQAAAFVMILGGNPGKAVMYLAALRSKSTELTMDTIADAFPDGFLSDEDLNQLWDAQKVVGGNLLDKELSKCINGL